MSRFKFWWWLGGTSNPYLAPYWHSMKITSDWLYRKGQDLSAVHGNICNIIRFQTQNLQSLNNSKIIYLWKQPICLVACRANYTSYIIIKSWQVRLFCFNINDDGHWTYQLDKSIKCNKFLSVFIESLGFGPSLDLSTHAIFQ